MNDQVAAWLCSRICATLGALRRVGVVESRREGHQILDRIRDDRIFQVTDRMRAILADQLSDAQHLCLQV